MANLELDAPPVSAVIDPARPMARKVLLLALPVLLQQFLILCVNLSDSFLAGNLIPLTQQQQQEMVGYRLLALGQLAGGGLPGGLAAEVPWEAAGQIAALHIAYQAAQTTANYLVWFISSTTVLVSVGSTALVARFVGAGDWRLAIRTTHQSLLLAIALGLVGTVLGLRGGGYLIRLLGLQGPAAEFATAYLQPIFLLLVFQVVELAAIACLVGAGDTRTGLWVMAGVVVLNLPLAWGFFLGWGPLPEMRFTGISTGTAVSHAVAAIVLVGLLMRGRAGLRLRLDELRPDWQLLRRLLRISIPAGVDSLSIVVGQLWFLTIVNHLGDTASSAHGIALRWESLGYLSGVAFGTAAMTLVGQNLGARQPAEAARGGWVAFGMGCGIMSVMGLVFFVLATPMFRVFCPHEQQQPVVEAGVPVLRLVAFAMPAVACWIIFTGALRGAGDTRVPVLFSWIGFFGVRIPLAYLLTMRQVYLGPLGIWPGADLGLFGAWLAMFADLMVRGGFFLHRFAGERWMSARV